MPQRARVLNAQDFGLKLAWMDCWQKPFHLSTPTLVNKLACPWDCILSSSTCSDCVGQWLNWKETLSITDFCLIWKNLRLNRSRNFFLPYCGNSFRKRVPWKKEFFSLGCGDQECGILLICWLAPPSSGMYKNTSFHKTLALGNKLVKQNPPCLLMLTLIYLNSSIIQTGTEPIFGKHGCWMARETMQVLLSTGWKGLVAVKLSWHGEFVDVLSPPPGPLKRVYSYFSHNAVLRSFSSIAWVPDEFLLTVLAMLSLDEMNSRSWSSSRAGNQEQIAGELPGQGRGRSSRTPAQTCTQTQHQGRTVSRTEAPALVSPLLGSAHICVRMQYSGGWEEN